MTPVEIKMGDHVLLLLGTEHDERRHPYQLLQEALRRSFPGVEFTFVCGVTGALVLPKGDAHD